MADLRDVVMLDNKWGIGFDQQDDLYLLRRITTIDGIRINKVRIGKVDHLVVEKDVTVFKKDNSWCVFPVGSYTNDFSELCVAVDLETPIFVRNPETPKSVTVPVIVTKDGLYMIGKQAHIRSLQGNLSLEQVGKTSRRYVYKYKVIDITPQDIQKLLSMKPKQMEAVITGNNQLTLYFLTEDGKLYGTGSNSGGRLGVPTNKVKEKKLLKEYQLISEDVKHIDAIPGGGLMYAKSNGTYYIGSNSGSARGLIKKSHTDTPYKIIDKILSRFDSHAVGYNSDARSGVTVFKFYTADGEPYTYNGYYKV